jgi:arylsulfatase A-like enzyme
MTQPNVVLIMCDDLGYGDTGFNGNRVIKTPGLDQLASEGAVFTRFYAGGPVCSPTRGTCLTGRHYSRYGITHANVGHLPVHEIPISRIAKGQGYRTGHFGKWHLGTLDPEKSSKSNRDPQANFAPPWERWYDESLCTEFAVPTWDPSVGFDQKTQRRTGERWGSPYFDNGKECDEPVMGCDSEFIVNRTIDFISRSAEANEPFFASVWFHAPHTPVEAGPEFFAMYDEYPENYAHYFGVVTAMDRQVGRLNQTLKDLGLEENTIIFFCSDNGPEGYADHNDRGGAFPRSRGSTGGLRGRKRSLFNGGIEVPAIVKWPGRVEAGERFEFPATTLDYLPTLTDLWSYRMPDDRPIDGVSLLPLFAAVAAGKPVERSSAIPYRFVESERAMFGAPTFAAISDRFKLLTNLAAGDESDRQLYDVVVDPYEKDNIIDYYPDEADALQRFVSDKMKSFRESHFGADYGDVSWEPVVEFQEVDQGWSNRQIQ